MPTNAEIYLLAVDPEDFRLEAATAAQGNFERLLLALGGNLPAYSILVGTKQRDQASVDYNPSVTEPCSVRRVRS